MKLMFIRYGYNSDVKITLLIIEMDNSVHGNGWVEWGQTRELHRAMVETFGQ